MTGETIGAEFNPINLFLSIIDDVSLEANTQPYEETPNPIHPNSLDND